MRDDLPPLLDRIRALLEAAPDNPAVALVTEMEHTLTDGYARALDLERERRRIEKRMGELLHAHGGPAEGDELRSLAARLRETDERLAGLRALLADLHRRVAGGGEHAAAAS